MPLPLATTAGDVRQITQFLARKPAGATIQDATAVLGESLVDKRKLATCQSLGIVERENGRLTLTQKFGRAIGRSSDEDFADMLRARLATICSYSKCIEWAYQQSMKSLTTNDVGAFWHDHYRDELGTSNERQIAQRANCFLQLADGSGLGIYVVGRRGQPTRLDLDMDAIEAFVHSQEFEVHSDSDIDHAIGIDESSDTATVATSENRLEDVDHADDVADADPDIRETREPSGGIFVGHGKNKKPLQQLTAILDQFKIPYKVATAEANLGRPISKKVRDTMQECNCAILIFSADEEFRDADGEVIWRPSENVVHEFGAAGFLYEDRIVILKEEDVKLPTNFRDIGYIPFAKDQLDAKAMDVLRELIGFGIVKVTT